MTAFVGRLLTITRSGSGPGPSAITGKMTKNLTLNNGEIDITSDDDGGFRTLLETPAVRSVDVSIEGVLKGDELLNLVADGPVQGTYVIDFGSIGVLSGTFQFGEIEIGAEHAGYVTFSTVMKSSGPFSYVSDVTT